MSRQRAFVTGQRLAAGDRRGPLWALLPCLLLAPFLALFSACSGGGTQPGTFRFGQDGAVQIRVTTPRRAGGGETGILEQTMNWRSTGQWRLVEEISYRGEPGDSTVRRTQGDPGPYASSYASFITLVNEGKGVKLFVDELDPDLEPECGRTRSRVSVRIHDPRRSETVEWVRCASGSFSVLDPGDAGPPSTGAPRVIQTARMARDFVLGPEFRSAYVGTVPFATLARKEKSIDGTPEPAIFLGSEDEPPAAWHDFWNTHVGSGEPPLEVNWGEEMVIAATVGEVPSAGNEVEVRRILPVDRGTQIEVFHRIPGDFCSPASGTHTPFHIVVAPRTTEPVRFQDQVRTEKFTCGV